MENINGANLQLLLITKVIIVGNNIFFHRGGIAKVLFSQSTNRFLNFLLMVAIDKKLNSTNYPSKSLHFDINSKHISMAIVVINRI